tara:strand:- start:1480 stop:1656 length:177 start_codon:yes stop_codon:yes gene_type:complete
MNQAEQTSAFSTDLDKLLTRYADEFDLTYASAIGVLTIALHRIIDDLRFDEDAEAEDI